ncbi:MAG: PrgI family protein [Candidatus Harrisonbacteria bacterium]|nr:PrgI family protein [Candidatus Harrisonbacteria bacterium]
MNFQVPQFIETEDKIVGPLTIKQFLFLAVAGGISFALFFFLQFILWLIITLFLGIIAASFAFIKINGQSFTTIAFSALNFYLKPHFYLWQSKIASEKIPQIKLPESGISPAKSRLNDLWEQLKTSRKPLPKREKSIEPAILDRAVSSKERFEMMRKITGEREVARRVDYR